MQARLAAARVVRGVEQGASLGSALPAHTDALPPAERARARALAYGVLRHWERLDALRRRLLRKPLKGRDRLIGALLLVGLHELEAGSAPDYAVVDALVRLARRQRPWAAGLMNACLRRFQRERAALLDDALTEPAARWGLPDWLLARLQRDWPDDWPAMAAASNRQAPMTLRVDLSRTTREALLERLAAAGVAATPHPQVASALTLAAPTDVTRLPGFAEGLLSVQDAAAQLAAGLLDPQPGERVLDACAAPGGKTVHLLERTAGRLALVAVESDPARVPRLRDNLARSGHAAEVVTADAAASGWWEGPAFDRILLDAPCSATGVVRRHPDIKRLRRAADVTALCATQARLLDRCWALLRPGGRLLYATCSVLAEENAAQVARFLARRPDAVVRPIAADWGRPAGQGRQILPGEHDMDGFFYACIEKREQG